MREKETELGVGTNRGESCGQAVKTPKASIVILNWNGYEVTRECLASLSQIDYPRYEIVLVDNGSTDGSPAKLAAEFPGVTFIRNQKNLGFTGGNNVGIRRALEENADYVLLLNNDTVVAPNFLSELIRAGESDKRIGLLNPKIFYFEPSNRIWYAGGSFNIWKGIASHRGHRQVDRGLYDAPEEVTFITGCAFLIKTEVIRHIGLLDDFLFYTCEDTDWTIRSLNAGYKALYVPSSVIWHKESIDVKRNAGKAFRDFYNVRNSLLLARRHAKPYHWPSFLFCLGRMVSYRTTGYLIRGEFDRVRALYRGLRDGFSHRSIFAPFEEVPGVGETISEKAGAGTAPEAEMVQLDDSALPRSPSIRVAINAITEAAPKFGSRVYLWELASALTRIDGVDLVLLVGQGQANDVPPLLRARVREISVSPRRSYWQVFRQKRIRQALLREKIDLYDIPNTLPLLGSVIPTVMTIHDLVDLRVRKYGVARTIYRFLVNFLAAHFADHILTVSENSKRDIVRLLLVPESKVTVVYNGVSEEFRPLNRKDCKSYLASKYSIMGDFLLAPGGLSRNKNIPRLLAAMRMLKERGRRESLVLLGDKENPEFKYVRVSVRRSGLDGTVLLPGFVPREDLPSFYNAASLVVYPTLYEGFGFPVLEAMACGTPVITSNNSSLPEVAGDAALLVDPRNPEEIAVAIRRLLADETLRCELSSRGILHARQFTWKATAEKTVEAFLKMAARREPMGAR